MIKKIFKIEIIIPLIYILLIVYYIFKNDFIFLRYGWIILAVLGGFEDSQTSLISDSWSLGIGLGGICNAVIFSHINSSILSFAITGVFYFILFLVFKNGFGLGDVIFSLALSLWLNPLAILIFFWIAAFSSLVFAFPKILENINTYEKISLPFTPFLAFSGIITYFYGEKIILLLQTLI